MVAIVAGLSVLWAVLLDALETVVLPRRVNRMLRLTAWYYRLTWGPWAGMTKRIKSQGRRESMLGYFGPLSLIFLLALWAAGLILGFALVQFGMGAHLSNTGLSFGLLLYLTFAMARHAVVDLSQVVVAKYDPLFPDRLPSTELSRLRKALSDRNLILREGAAAEEKLAALRAMYEPYVVALAQALLITLPPWQHAGRRPDNWQVAPWDEAIAARNSASTSSYHSEDHF